MMMHNNKPYNQYNQYNKGPPVKYDKPKINSLQSIEVRELLLNYLFSSLEMSRYRYKIINNINDLTVLKDNKFYVSGNYAGINCLLVFIKLHGYNYSFTIDRKTLNYSLNNIDVQQVKMFPAKIRLEENIYNGTIFDGVFNNTTKEFIITDVLCFRGKDVTRENIHHKFLSVTSYLQKFYNKNSLNNMDLIVNKLYELKDLQELVNDISPSSLTSQAGNGKGIIFQPEISGSYPKLIYLLQDGDLNIDKSKTFKGDGFTEKGDTTPPTKQQTSVKDAVKDTVKDTLEIDTSKLNEGDIITFIMRSTATDDVYKLYLLHKSKKENGKTIVRPIKVSIAYIPDIKNSKMCRTAFGDDKEILMDCIYDKDKNKWIPKKKNNTADHAVLINDYIM